MLPKQSAMMNKLYGKDLAAKVYARCQELGENFNTLVQEVVYDQIWARPGLSIREKSLATIISLTALNKAEQLKIHLTGFFAQGGTPTEIASIFKYLQTKQYIASADAAFAMLKTAASESQLKDYPETAAAAPELALDDEEKTLIDFASHIAIGNQPKTKAYLKLILDSKALSLEKIENIMLHQIMYCGFPCAMNGYVALFEIRGEPATADGPPPKQSDMMTKLYGAELAKKVYARCQQLGQQFNALVQGMVYDQFWARPGLSFREKSLATIISLAVLNKAEQLDIHLRGFIASKNKPMEMASILKHLNHLGLIDDRNASVAFNKLQMVSEEMGIDGLPDELDRAGTLTLNAHETALINLAAHIANGDQVKTQTCMNHLLLTGDLSESDIENIMLHQIMYCGFPCAMNGYVALTLAKQQATSTEGNAAAAPLSP